MASARDFSDPGSASTGAAGRALLGIS